MRRHPEVRALARLEGWLRAHRGAAALRGLRCAPAPQGDGGLRSRSSQPIDRCKSGHPGQFLIFRIFARRRGQISTIAIWSRPTEGRLAIVTNAGGDAVDAAERETNAACWR